MIFVRFFSPDHSGFDTHQKFHESRNCFQIRVDFSVPCPMAFDVVWSF